ncbi:MAG TPA: hypothetical protein VMJ64_14640, partial [Anaerolineales bacterium]|nr:hypothetical protein [Anaerolineales bacterium]
ARQGQLLLLKDSAGADELLERAVQINASIGDQYSIAANTGNFGWELDRLGQKERARPYLLRAADLFERIGMHEQAEQLRKAAEGE